MDRVESIISSLEAWADLASSGYSIPGAASIMLEAAEELKRLNNEMKRLIDDGK